MLVVDHKHPTKITRVAYVDDTDVPGTSSHQFKHDYNNILIIDIQTAAQLWEKLFFG